ncbi:threonine ammonia-lyase, biosynthetic [Burkholderiaceae bacterium DAT-1]|nr:threonine ammonia-lyase, biosynthetic [Burkholderiaceae bacterium DAT-1]
MAAPTDYLERILTAHVYDVAIETALDPMPALSARNGNQILLKREDNQPVFSFKLRGAYNCMVNLTPEQRAKGVVAASAGNHAQGVALAARKLGCTATIFMPATTPQIKINAVERRGGKVILHGDSYSDAYAQAMQYVEATGATFVHPYDDPHVIAGQGTVAMELLRQTQDIDAVFIPVGGGGLAAGMAAYIKRLRPDIKVIGVEPVDAASMHDSIKAGERVVLPNVGLFADGVAVKQVGEETFRLCRDLLDEVVLVDTDAMCAAIKDVFEDTRSILEAAGALAVAGLKAWSAREGVSGKRLVAIASGANMNFDRLRHVSERAELGEQREAVLAVTIPEMPGTFRRFCELLGNRSVTEFNYRYSNPTHAHIFVGLQIQNRAEVTELVKLLNDNDFRTLDLTDNEMAKLHIRHLVGGRAPEARHELVYRFEFPERPGALLNFLTQMGRGWNISLFHYRNHGADYGRVLVGMQVPPGEAQAFQAFLDSLGYDYADERNNPAYMLFLGS